MSTRQPFHLGLIVRGLPYDQRSPRTQLDIALLAATLDFSLSLYFVGAAVLQLTAGAGADPNGTSATGAALLPAGYRAWASLPELFERAELVVFAETAWLDRLQRQGLHPCLPVQASEALAMRLNWNRCDRVLVA